MSILLLWFHKSRFRCEYVKSNNEAATNLFCIDFKCEKTIISNMSKFTFIDLFAGIGGIRIAFESCGGRCVFSSEIDKWAVQTYKANFGDTPCGDITKIQASDIPDFDILTGGFPCQAFSQAGLKKGFNDARGTLFFDVARILSEKKPKAFFLENVKGLLSHDHGKTFSTIRRILSDDLGYKIFYKVLNAKDYGVPQNRERIMIVGFLDSNINFEFPSPLKKKTKVADILEANVPDKYTISDKLWAGHQKRKALNIDRHYGFGYSLFTPDSPYTSTISARYYKDGSEILIAQENKNPRKLTPREAARLQGFPDDFKIVVGDSHAYKQFGNSVPVKMITAVAKKMIKAMYDGQKIH